MNERKNLIERKERTILDNPPSEETALKWQSFYENIGSTYISCS